MNERYRNHPIVIARSVMASFILLLVIIANIMTNAEEAPELTKLGVLVLIIPLLFLIYGIISWSKTYITIEEDHALAEKWVLYHVDKVIPYGKVASVNEVRGIIGRLIGVTTLQININSAKNAARPELTFTFKDDLAQYVSRILKHGLDPVAEQQQNSVETEETVTVPADVITEADCLYRFGLTDAVMFGIFGANTWSLIMAIVFGAYSAFSIIFQSSTSIISIVFMVFSGIVPMVSSIIRHGDFRVYRKGDKIRLKHGMLTLYDTSFNISRVNAVTVKRSFFARIIGKCSIEAEVVGINAQESDVTPTITLLIPESRLGEAMSAIFPEFVTDYELRRQPRSALAPRMTKTTIITAVWLAFFSVIMFSAWKYDSEFDNRDFLIISAFLILEPAIAIPHTLFAYRMVRIGYGDRFFTTRTGVVDSKECVMQYSKVQIYDTVSSPMARRRGLAKASFSLLSSAGARAITVGFFPKEELDTVGTRSVEQSGTDIAPKSRE